MPDVQPLDAGARDFWNGATLIGEVAQYAQAGDSAEQVKEHIKLSNLAKSKSREALTLLGKINPSEKAKRLSNEAHELSLASHPLGTDAGHTNRMAGNAHHEAAKIHSHEGDSDIADLHQEAAKHHFKISSDSLRRKPPFDDTAKYGIAEDAFDVVQDQAKQASKMAFDASRKAGTLPDSARQALSYSGYEHHPSTDHELAAEQHKEAERYHFGQERGGISRGDEFYRNHRVAGNAHRKAAHLHKTAAGMGKEKYAAGETENDRMFFKEAKKAAAGGGQARSASEIARESSKLAHAKSNTLGVVKSKGDVAAAGNLGKVASTPSAHRDAAFLHKTASAIHWLIATNLPGDASASHFEAARLHDDAARVHALAAGSSEGAVYNHHKTDKYADNEIEGEGNTSESDVRKAYLRSGKGFEHEQGPGGPIMEPRHGVHVGKLESVNPTAGTITVGGRRFQWKHNDYHASGSGYRSYESARNLQKHVGRNVAVSWVNHHAFGPTVFGKSNLTLGEK